MDADLSQVTSGNMKSAHDYLRCAGVLIKNHDELRSKQALQRTSIDSVLRQIHSYIRTIFRSTYVLRSSINAISQSNTSILFATSNPFGVQSAPFAEAGVMFLPSAANVAMSSTPSNLDNEELSFLRIYGIPKTLITFISRTDELTRVNEFLDRDLTGSACSHPDFQSSCQLLEDQICDMNLDGIQGLNVDVLADHRITTYLSHAVHNALIVTFFRRIRRVNRTVLQHYVEATADYLNQQEDIKSRNGIKTPALLWPWFMAASEATGMGTRQKFLHWAHNARRYGGRNLEAAEEVIRETWNRIDEKSQYATWADVVRERDITLMLT
jgi:hypothetical protein